MDMLIPSKTQTSEELSTPGDGSDGHELVPT